MSSFTSCFQKRDLAMGLAVFLLAGLLIAPLFGIEYFDNWGSIDSTFLAHARFLMEHWPHPNWQPLWYCGTRFDYIYPPALPYGTASLAILSGVSPARAYHLYTAFLYCIGIAGVFFFVRAGSGFRFWAAIAAAGAATLSPSFLILRSFRDDAALQMPQRLNVLIKWGEGPHMSALALLPFALLFSWRSLRGEGSTQTVLAAVFSALVVSHNFYGATALAIFFCLLVWSIWIAQCDRVVLLRALSIGALAYGLTAFWLTPSYLRITIDNLRLVAQPGNPWSKWVALAVISVFMAASWRFARKRQDQSYAVFVCGSVLIFALIVVGNYYAGFRIVGEPHRFVPELDLVLLLGAVAVLQRLANGRGLLRRVAIAAAVIASFSATRRYLADPWSVFVADSDFRKRVEFRLAEWIEKNLPDSRTFVTGSLRFWYNVWTNGAQVGGGSEQGLLNSTLAVTQWQVIQDLEVERDIAWLQAVGADAVVVPQQGSSVMFLEYPAPRKFAGLLPVLYDDGQGNIIYRVPRRFPSRARIVKTADSERLRAIPIAENNRSELQAYVATIEAGPDRSVEVHRTSPESITLRGLIYNGESLIVQESYDPAWRAYSQGRDLSIHKDAAGFMRVDVPPGQQEVQMKFETPVENIAGRVATVASGLIIVLVLLQPRRRLRSRRP